MQKGNRLLEFVRSSLFLSVGTISINNLALSTLRRATSLLRVVLHFLVKSRSLFWVNFSITSKFTVPIRPFSTYIISPLIFLLPEKSLGAARSFWNIRASMVGS